MDSNELRFSHFKYFVRTNTKEESEISFERIKKFLELHELGLWVAEETKTDSFMGFIGLSERPELDIDHPKIKAGEPTRNHVVFST